MYKCAAMFAMFFHNLLELLKVFTVCLTFHQLFCKQMNKLWCGNESFRHKREMKSENGNKRLQCDGMGERCKCVCEENESVAFNFQTD